MFLEWLNRHPQISCHRNRLIRIFSWKKILYDTFFVHLKQREKRKLRQMQSIGEEMRVRVVGNYTNWEVTKKYTHPQVILD